MSRKTEEAKRELRRKKVAANLLAGLNYRDMAEAFGVSIGTIASDVKIVMKRWQKEQVDQVDQYQQVKLRRLDRSFNAVWDDVLAGKPSAINSMIKIMDKQDEVWGVNTQTNVNLNIDYSTLTDEQLQRIANGEDPIVVAGSG